MVAAGESASRAWLHFVTPDAVAELIGRVPDAFTFRAELEYRTPPSMPSDDRVAAHLARPGAKRGARAFVEYLGDRAIGTECTCGFVAFGNFRCPHVEMLLADLAIDADLRDALVASGRVDAIVARLPARRREYLDARRVRAQLDAWLPDPAYEADVILQVEAVASPFAYDDATGAVVLRVRRAGTRGAIDPRDVEAMNLSPHLARLLAFAEVARKKTWIASGPNAASLLRALREELEGSRGDLEADVRFVDATATPRMTTRETHDQVVVDVAWARSDGGEPIEARDALIFAGPASFVLSRVRREVLRVAGDVDLRAVKRMQTTLLALPKSAAPEIGHAILRRARHLGIALPPREAFGLPSVDAPRIVLRLWGDPRDVHGRLEAVYGARTVLLLPGAGRDLARDDETELAAIDAMYEAGLVFEDDGLVVRGDEAAAFWREGITKLRASQSPRIELLAAGALANVAVRSPVRAKLRLLLQGGWLHASLRFQADDVPVEMQAIREALAARQRWIKLGDGSLARIEEALSDVASDASALLDENGAAKLKPHQLGRVDAWTDVSDIELEPDAIALRDTLRSAALRDTPEVPAELRAELRPYQRRGLAWLQFVRELGAGGILADDMGLGKTLMTLALLAWCREKEGAAPSLVVCPTSVCGNWLREAARFAPDLRVVLLHGARRDASPRAIAAADLAVTTYGTLRRDAEALADVPFRCLVLDEAQNVKNDDAQTTHAARRLRAETRIALSGTPVENRLRELWSIMNVVNPGMLGRASEFAERFEKPISEDPRDASAERLRRIIRPFVLRRTKREVLTELPPKTEIERACVLSHDERRLYDALAHTLRREVAQSIKRHGVAQSRFTVLTAILRLRQMACDPTLIDWSSQVMGSKRLAFLDIVRELVAEGRRALVFSQFTQLLTRWRYDLSREGIDWEYLDGKSRRRDQIVARFQEGDAPIFFVSLKAGGAGLNLTAADTVIHCDPWWNPAVEDQATDRAHRIGQDKPVTVIRLVARGTIEDRIAVLKAKKRAIADAIIGDGWDLGALTADDVRELLANVDDD